MKYVIEQNRIIRTDYTIWDENHNEAYFVDSKDSFFKWDRNIYDCYRQKLAYLIQKNEGLKSHFEIYVNNQLVGIISKKGSIFKNDYVLENSDLSISGNFWSTEYQLTNDDGIVATITSKAFSFKTLFEIEVEEQYEPVICISIALALDIIHRQEAAVASA